MPRSLPLLAVALLLGPLGLPGAALGAAAGKAPAKKGAGKADDCGRNLNCLSLAAKTCAPATATHEMALNMMGVEQRSTARLEILGRDGARCLFKTTPISASVKLGPQARQAAMKQGKNAAQIDQAEREANEKALANLGPARTCKIAPAQLSQVITRWKNGSFSSSDLPAQDCK